MTAPSFAASRRADDETVCTFQPKNGRYSDRCRETATYEVPRHPQAQGWVHQERRCDKHLAIDKRTEAKRGWGERTYQYVPFDAAARRAQVIADETAKEVEHETMFWAHLTDAVAERDLAEVRRLAQRGRL